LTINTPFFNGAGPQYIPAVEFRVLGPVEVRAADRPLTVPGRVQRAVLASLILAGSRPVASGTLIDAIWGARLPKFPATALQISVSRLRAAFGPADRVRLVSAPSAYRLDTRSDEVDLRVVETMLHKGRMTLAAGQAAAAARQFDRALGEWRGPPLIDLGRFPFYDLAARRLRELRLSLIECRADAYLICGRHHELASDLAPFVRAEPWRERLHALQMLALYRCGRQTEALAIYRALRQGLVDALGIAPGAEVEDLYLRILRQDPELTAGGFLPHRWP
jgi:DNA-binding SARP family transcriptional activator